MGKVLLATVASSILLLLTAGCGPKRLEVALSAPPSPTGATSLAGAARVDVTPPLGPSLYGHGPQAERAQGHRGRLFCRAIYLQDARGEAVALVTCDLMSISLLLNHHVAAELKERIGLGMDRLLISATHTHGGPAHYFGVEAYSGAFSSMNPGRDPRMIAFLTERIADAVERARKRALAGGPARIAWIDARLPEGTTRNSSMDPHCGNPEPLPGLGDQETTCGRPNQRPDSLAEVDGRMTTLRVERLAGEAWKLVAVHATIAMHPTVVDNVNTLFHADAYGVAATHAEGRLNRTDGVYPDPEVIVALANGHGGDTIGNFGKQGWDEALRIGTILGDTLTAAATTPAPGVEGFEVGRVFGLYGMERAPVIPEGSSRPVPVRIAQQGAKPGATLCKDAELGNPAAGGAEDGRTAFYYTAPLFQEGARNPKRRDACHRPRRSYESFLKKLSLSRHGFPDHAPLQIVRVGDRALAGVPAELSTTAGLALEAELASQLGIPVRVVGYANGYIQYVTTHQEYRWQYYQGASNLWGPDTLAFLWARLAGLVDRAPWTGPQAVDLAEPETPFHLPGKKRRLPDPRDLKPKDPKMIWSRPLPQGGGFQLMWRGQSPTSTHPDPDGDGVFDELPVRMRVERCESVGDCQPLLDAHGVPVDDRSVALELRYLGRRTPEQALPGARQPRGFELHDAGRRPRKKDHHHWMGTWYADGVAAGSYRVVILDRAGSELVTETVTIP